MPTATCPSARRRSSAGSRSRRRWSGRSACLGRSRLKRSAHPCCGGVWTRSSRARHAGRHAITPGTATLVMPSRSIQPGHALAALLGFAAFLVVRSERERATRSSRSWCWPVAAGLAVTTEYLRWRSPARSSAPTPVSGPGARGSAQTARRAARVMPRTRAASLSACSRSCSTTAAFGSGDQAPRTTTR